MSSVASIDCVSAVWKLDHISLEMKCCDGNKQGSTNSRKGKAEEKQGWGEATDSGEEELLTAVWSRESRGSGEAEASTTPNGPEKIWRPCSTLPD